MDRCVGGRVHETWDDGTEVDWGEVLAWSPPERFAMTWADASRDAGAGHEGGRAMPDSGPR
ncbi:MAG TPA: hypothetical protein VH478_06410 [Trebonia sp.]|nr:hypothetical protein [Trebonia sp.]